MLSTSKQEGTKSFKPLWGHQGQEIYTSHKMSCHQRTLSPETRPTAAPRSHSRSGCSPRVLVTTTGKASSLIPNSVFKSGLKKSFQRRAQCLQSAPPERSGSKVTRGSCQPYRSTARSYTDVAGPCSNYITFLKHEEHGEASQTFLPHEFPKGKNT